MSLLLDDVSIVVTPNGYKAGTLYGVLPTYAEGSEDVVNGDFASGGTSWNTNTGWTITTGIATSVGATADINQGFWSPNAESQYKVTFEVKTITAGGVRFRFGGVFGATRTEPGVYTEIITTIDTERIRIASVSVDSSHFSGTITNISVKEVTSSDMDVTRATAATRVDEDGLVNYAEIIGSELVTNGDFELNSDWNNFSTPTTSEQSTEQSHTGTYSWKVIADATQEGIFSPNNFSITNGNSYSVSLWIYSVSGNSIKSGLNNTNVSVFTERTVIAGQWTNITYEATATSTGASYISILSQNSLNFYVDDVSVKEVTRDNVPRIDYTGGGCPHILAEPQRTNLIQYSEDLSQSYWRKDKVTVTPNSIISPSGELNASLIQETVYTSSVPSFDLNGAITLSAGTYTYTFYVKNNNGRYLGISFGSSGERVRTNFDFTTNTFKTLLFSGTTTGTASFTTLGDFYRITITATFPSSIPADTVVMPLATDTYPYYANQNSDNRSFYLWGFSVEEGSYATSYIPNFGTSSGVTRNQDIFTRDGISSLINSTEGVLFLEISAINDMESEQKITINNGGINELIEIYYRFGRIYGGVRVGGIVVASIFYTPIDKTLSYKCAVKWELNSVSFWVDGVKIGEDLSASTPIGLSKLSFDRGNGTLNFFGKVKQLQVYKTALTDEQLLQLTGESGTDFYESYAEMAAALTYTIQ